MANNWGDTFAAAFSNSYEGAAERKFKKWLENQNSSRPVYSLDGTGKLVPVGAVPDGSQVISPNYMMTPEQKMEMELEKVDRKAQQAQLSTARKAFDTYSSDAMQAMTALEKIEKYSKDLPDFKRGVMNQVGAKVKTGVNQFAKEKNVTRYIGVVAQELIPMARKLMEEKGPITEFDVARVEKGFGDLTIPQEDRLALINELRNKVKQAILNKMNTSEYSFKDITGKYKMIADKVFGKTMKFNVGGTDYEIPLEEVDDFKKEMGL